MKAYNFDITLSNNTSLELATQGIYLELYTNSTTFAGGTFAYSNLEYPTAGHFTGYSDIYIGDSDGESIALAGGTVTVTVNGNTYEITVNCTTEENKQVVGYYKGTLKYFDQTIYN